MDFEKEKRISLAIIAKYGDLSFPVPPVCTALWEARDWFRWIESYLNEKDQTARDIMFGFGK